MKNKKEDRLKYLEKELPYEDFISVEEASELIDFFGRYDIVSSSGVFSPPDYKYGSRAGSFRYLSSGELMLKGLNDKEEGGISHFFTKKDFIGSDVFLVDKNKDSLIFRSLCKEYPDVYFYLSNGERLNLFEANETPKSYEKNYNSDKRFPKREYEKKDYTESSNLWPVYFKHNVLPSLEYGPRFEIPVKKSLERFHLHLEKESFLKMVKEIYGEENKSELDRLFPGSDAEYPGYIQLLIKEEDFSDLESKKESKIVPLSLSLDNRRIHLSKPSKDSRMIFKHDVKDLEKKLVENIVMPEDIGNGVVVMSRENIPKYLTRKIGL